MGVLVLLASRSSVQKVPLANARTRHALHSDSVIIPGSVCKGLAVNSSQFCCSMYLLAYVSDRLWASLFCSTFTSPVQKVHQRTSYTQNLWSLQRRFVKDSQSAGVSVSDVYGFSGCLCFSLSLSLLVSTVNTRLRAFLFCSTPIVVSSKGPLDAYTPFLSIRFVKDSQSTRVVCLC
ncbi:hypothetical protein CPC08DRAFT_429487 [Agrocybe pediades]|nr:hypothetical protein CPC08DRAFT_429487 [Agrocybe pediades]